MAASYSQWRAGLRRAGFGEWAPFAVFTAAWAVAVVAPVLGIFVFSLARMRGLRIDWTLSFAAYADIVESGRWTVLARTAGMAGAVTLIVAAVGIPFGIWMAKGRKPLWLDQTIWMALTVPFFLDPSARALVWRAVLGSTGAVNSSLMALGLAQAPIKGLLFSDFAVGFGLVGNYFPNMVWPVFLAALLVDDDLLAAARDLGAGPARVLTTVTLPLAAPGVLAGAVFTFVPILGDNVVTNLLGGGKTEYLADSVASLSTTMNYTGAAAFSALVLGTGAALAFALLVVGRMLRLGGAA